MDGWIDGWMDRWIYVCMHACMCVCVYVCLYVCMYVCPSVCIYTYIYIYIHIYIYTYIYIHIYIHIYIYLYIYMYVYVYTYVYMVQSSLFLHVIFSHSTPILPLSLLPAWHAGHRQKGGDDGGEGACGAVHHAGPRRGGSHGPWRLPKSSILGYHHFCKPPSII